MNRMGPWVKHIIATKNGVADQDDSAVRLIDYSIETEIINDTSIGQTEKEAVILARRGQGKFRQNLESIEKCCRVTRVTDPRLFRASHIKPWRSCENTKERLDGNNGLLLSRHVDHLFDKGYISFLDTGDLLISSVIARDQLKLLGLKCEPPINVGKFSEEQKQYLAFHREKIFMNP